MSYLLSILIPTISGRETEFNALYATLQAQVAAAGRHESVEIIFLKDNKEISIGAKRQQLLNRCNGEYSVMCDDDDMLSENYIARITHILESEKPDCIGYLESVVINDIKKIACHSNRFDDWGVNTGGYDYVRTIFYKDVIKTSIARRVGFQDLRYAEDRDFSVRLKASGLLKNEIFIPEIMYFYFGKILRRHEFYTRYGYTFNK